MKKPATNRRERGHRAYFRGLWAETLCCLALRLKFYRILHRRYKTSLGEIDIIAARGRTLVFIEVKARQRYETAAQSISPQQQERLIRAARVFMARHPALTGCDVRFDALFVAKGRWPVHIENAFDGHPQLF